MLFLFISLVLLLFINHFIHSSIVNSDCSILIYYESICSYARLIISRDFPYTIALFVKGRLLKFNQGSISAFSLVNRCNYIIKDIISIYSKMGEFRFIYCSMSTASTYFNSFTAIICLLLSVILIFFCIVSSFRGFCSRFSWITKTAALIVVIIRLIFCCAFNSSFSNSTS